MYDLSLLRIPREYDCVLFHVLRKSCITSLSSIFKKCITQLFAMDFRGLMELDCIWTLAKGTNSRLSVPLHGKILLKSCRLYEDI